MSQLLPEGEKIIAFGDVHLCWQATQVILNYARKQEIDNVVTLGDEGHKIYPFETGDKIDYQRHYHEIRRYQEENPKRIVVSVLGDKTVWVPKDLYSNYIGVDSSGNVQGPSIYHHKNIIALHHGERIAKGKCRTILDEYSGEAPLVIFHGSSHSIGCLSRYKWLAESEFVFLLENREERHQLKRGKVYWVNPGGNFMRNRKGQNCANLAVYDQKNQEITLLTIPYDQHRVKSTFKR